MVMIMILMGAQRLLLRNFHILSHGPELVEHGINIFILVPFPLEQGKPSMQAIFSLHSGEQEGGTLFSTWSGCQAGGEFIIKESTRVGLVRLTVYKRYISTISSRFFICCSIFGHGKHISC